MKWEISNCGWISQNYRWDGTPPIFAFRSKTEGAVQVLPFYGSSSQTHMIFRFFRRTNNPSGYKFFHSNVQDFSISGNYPLGHGVLEFAVSARRPDGCVDRLVSRMG